MRGRRTDLAPGVSPSSRGGVGLRSERGPVLLALMVSTGLIAIDATILATAVPSIVHDVGGFAQFPWLFSVYLLAQAVSVSVYAKLADTVGRKPIILLGIGLFLAGSVLCGVAWSMTALIAFRAVQGLGAGAVAPIAITIAGDIYTVAERATAQGYIASVWADVVGRRPHARRRVLPARPWRWIFLVNVPLCLLAAGLILRNFHETVERTEHHVDYLGAVLLTSRHDPGHPRRPRRRAGLGVGLPGQHRGVRGRCRAARRVRSRRAARGRAGPAAVGAAPAPARDDDRARPRRRRDPHRADLVRPHLPARARSARRPLVAGLALAALTIGWPIAATLSGRLFYMRFGFRPTVLIGLGLAVVGTGSLALLAHPPSVAVVAVTCFVTGLGLGLVASPSLIAAQASVAWDERGVATGANMFARSIGSAVGAPSSVPSPTGSSRRPDGRRPTRSPRPTPERRCSSPCWWRPCSPSWPGC